MNNIELLQLVIAVNVVMAFMTFLTGRIEFILVTLMITTIFGSLYLVVSLAMINAGIPLAT